MKPNSFKWLVPNALTLLRIVLVVFLARAILRQPIIWIGEVALLFALILATDIIDGPIARRMQTTSRFGSVLDIVADVFYVLATTTALVIREVLPLIVLVCMVVELVVYFVTARLIARRTAAPAMPSASQQVTAAPPLPIERIGKAVALFYFAIPPLALFAAWGIFTDWPIPALTVLCILLTTLAIANRLRLLFASLAVR